MVLTCRNRSPIRFSVLTETNGGTEPVRFDKANAGPAEFNSVMTDKRTRGPIEPNPNRSRAFVFF